MINVAIRCARSLHSRLAQTTPPWERTYFNVRRRHRGNATSFPARSRSCGEDTGGAISSRARIAGRFHRSPLSRRPTVVSRWLARRTTGEPDVMVSVLDVAQVAERHAAQFGELRLREPFLLPEISDSPSSFSLNCFRRIVHYA